MLRREFVRGVAAAAAYAALPAFEDDRVEAATFVPNPYKPALPVPTVLAIMDPMAGTKVDEAGFEALKALVARRSGSLADAGEAAGELPPTPQHRS